MTTGAPRFSPEHDQMETEPKIEFLEFLNCPKKSTASKSPNTPPTNLAIYKSLIKAQKISLISSTLTEAADFIQNLHQFSLPNVGRSAFSIRPPSSPR